MFEKPAELKALFEQKIASVTATAEIEQLRIEFLGKKGSVSALMQELRNVPNEQKKEAGQKINETKQFIESAIAAKLEEIKALEDALNKAKEELAKADVDNKAELTALINGVQANLDAVKASLEAKDTDILSQLATAVSTLENADVDKCILLRKRLNDTLRMEGDNGKNQLLLGQSQMRLDDGDRLRTKLEERRKKASQILDDALAKLVIHKFISVFDYVAEVSGIIEDGLPYVYPEDYVEYMRQANRRICN